MQSGADWMIGLKPENTDGYDGNLGEMADNSVRAPRSQWL